MLIDRCHLIHLQRVCGHESGYGFAEFDDPDGTNLRASSVGAPKRSVHSVTNAVRRLYDFMRMRALERSTLSGSRRYSRRSVVASGSSGECREVDGSPHWRPLSWGRPTNLPQPRERFGQVRPHVHDPPATSRASHARSSSLARLRRGSILPPWKKSCLVFSTDVEVDLRTPAELSRYFRDRVMQQAETEYVAGG